MEKFSFTAISVEELARLSDPGAFFVTVNLEEKANELLKKFNLYEYRGAEPFHGGNKDPLKAGHIYLWLRTRRPMILYLVQKYIPTDLQRLIGVYPDLMVLQCSISLSKQEETLQEIANILDPQKQ